MAEGASVYKAAKSIQRRETLKQFLCDDAAHGEENRMVVKLASCVECESPCAYGLRYLELMTVRDLEKLSCGADCRECRDTSCRLRWYLIPKQDAAKRAQQDEWLKHALAPVLNKKSPVLEHRR